MKSVKKRFRVAVEEVAEAADGLALLSAHVTMLEPVQRLSGSAKEACYLLANRSHQLEKSGFVEQIRGEPALETLERLADTDVISEIEELFADTMPGSGEHQLIEFVQQFTSKLEKHLLVLNTRIQKLGELLDEDESSNVTD